MSGMRVIEVVLFAVLVSRYTEWDTAGILSK